MDTVRLNAYAKLNLTLDVKGVKEGYHMLDSLVVTVDVADRVIVRRRKDEKVRVVMHGGGSEQIENNNAERAGIAFRDRFQTAGADITVYKNIPIGAGMGGSSADAAAVVAGMGAVYGISDMPALKEVADGLGSDTGYLLSGGLARIRGRGDEVTKLPFPPAMHFLVLVPEAGVSTPQCFGAFDEMGLSGGNRTEEAVKSIGGELFFAARLFGNDLYPAAKSLCPAVEEAYLSLRAFSPLGAGMTGSGSAAFALFETAELAAWAKSRYRGKCRAILTKSVPARDAGI